MRIVLSMPATIEGHYEHRDDGLITVWSSALESSKYPNEDLDTHM